MSNQLSRVVFLGALLATIPAPGNVAEAQQIAAPRPIGEPRPPRPVNRRGISVDGWAVVRYSVLKDGTTDNIRITDMVPPSADPEQTRKAVTQWTFMPATEDGEPIDWHNNETLVTFGEAGEAGEVGGAGEAGEAPAADDAPEAAGSFADAYSAIGDMIEAEEYDDALNANEDLLNELAVEKPELGLALAQATIIQIGKMDYQHALEWIRLVTDPRLDVLSVDDQDRLIALQLRLQVEAQLGRTRDAIDTFERIDSAVAQDETNPFAPIANDLQRNWRDAEILQVLGRVDEHPWRFDAGRRIFTIDNVDGRIRAIDAQCDRRRLTLDYQPDVEWQLPDSLGDCVLFVDASPGTTFSFFELLPAE